jgi:hypothetical protein
MHFGVCGLKRLASIGLVLVLASLILSCGSSTSKTTGSGLPFRVFVSQDVSVPVSTTFPVGVPPQLFIIDAINDLLSPATVQTANLPGQLFLSQDKKITLAVGVTDNSVSIVENATETSSGKVTLPGPTASIVISPDASTAYAAVIDASVVGQPPGAVMVINLVGSGSLPFIISVPGARYLAESHNGDRVLVFSDNSDTITAIAPDDIGTGVDPRIPVPGFDRPVAAFFTSDDSTAYILNCGPECGGHLASVQVLDLTTNLPVGAPIPVDAATVGLLNGDTLYVAGTPPTSPANSCTGATTAATACGRLDVVNLGSMAVMSRQVITDGYHNRIDLSSNGQLFIGAQNCTNVSNASEVRGCLSIFNTVNPAVVIPPQNGNVTGVQAISNRNVVYVVQDAQLQIYDTTIDKLGLIQITLTGEMVDVKQVDF